MQGGVKLAFLALFVASCLALNAATMVRGAPSADLAAGLVTPTPIPSASRVYLPYVSNESR